MSESVAVFAPGRVNLIGEHVDYAGGLVLPMAIAQGTTLTGERGGRWVELTSRALGGSARVSLDDVGRDHPGERSGAQPGGPPWAAHLAGLVAALRPATGYCGVIGGDLPVGAGLSSSASLGVALALATGFNGTPLQLARAVMAAEAQALGVACGLMDPLVVAAAHAGQALLIDCASEAFTPQPVPPRWCFWLIDTGVRRDLGQSGYAERRSEVEAAQARIGPLRGASLADVHRLDDPLLARRARHVVSEISRVHAFVGDMQSEDMVSAGALLDASHESLSCDFAVSTPELDACVAHVRGLPGVAGARLTGAGFGGFVLALAAPGTQLPGFAVQPSDGAGLG